jgi:hypothetical protein
VFAKSRSIGVMSVTYTKVLIKLPPGVLLADGDVRGSLIIRGGLEPPS